MASTSWLRQAGFDKLSHPRFIYPLPEGTRGQHIGWLRQAGFDKLSHPRFIYPLPEGTRGQHIGWLQQAGFNRLSHPRYDFKASLTPSLLLSPLPLSHLLLSDLLLSHLLPDSYRDSYIPILNFTLSTSFRYSSTVRSESEYKIALV